jgi:hypothetical protein
MEIKGIMVQANKEGTMREAHGTKEYATLETVKTIISKELLPMVKRFL